MSICGDEVIRFSLDIEELVWQHDISYIEAVVMFCEDNGIEYEIASKLISPTLKSKIQIEAESLNCLPRSNTARLPI